MKKFVYKKLIPKFIKKQIENRDYRYFLELSPEVRKEKLKVNKIFLSIITYYCYFYAMLYIFFDVEKLSGWAGVSPEKKVL